MNYERSLKILQYFFISTISGLIPSSSISWKTAIQALKPTGGVLHVHANVEEIQSKIPKHIIVSEVILGVMK